MIEDFSERLRAARARAGLIQQDLADKLDVSLGSVGNWESGQNRPSPTMLRKIADELQVSIGWLLGDEPAHQRGASGSAKDESPSWQHELVSRLSALPESRLRRALAAFHSVLDALHEPAASHNPEVRYSAPKPRTSSSSSSAGMASLAQLGALVAGQSPGAGSPPLTSTVSPSGKTPAPAPPAPRGISPPSKAPGRVPISPGNPA